MNEMEAELAQGQAKVKGELEGALKQTETELFWICRSVSMISKKLPLPLGELGEGRGPVSSF
jgi:hypothetical protein